MSRHHRILTDDSLKTRTHVVDRLPCRLVKDDVPILTKLKIPQTTKRIQVAYRCGRVAVLVYNHFPGVKLTFERLMVRFELVVSRLQVAEAVPVLTGHALQLLIVRPLERGFERLVYDRLR